MTFGRTTAFPSPLRTVPLSGGRHRGESRSSRQASLSVDIHNITALYSGATGYISSTGFLATNPLIVSQASTTAALTAMPDPAVFGEPVSLIATVSSQGPGTGCRRET